MTPRTQIIAKTLKSNASNPIPSNKINSTLFKLKKAKKKDFKLEDSTGKCMEFHTIILESSITDDGEGSTHKLSRLQAEINNDINSFKF